MERNFSDRINDVPRSFVREILDVDAEKIPITRGSQQGRDLLARTPLDEGDGLVIEAPGYLGAIQAFSIFGPKFLPVAVADAGMDIAGLRDATTRGRPERASAAS